MKLFLLFAALLLQTPSPRGSVTGTVIVSGTSAPIADADVTILAADGLLETTTDAAGRFSFASVPVGRQTVVIRADGFFGEPPSPDRPFLQRVEVPVTVTAGASAVAVPSVSLVQSGTVTGKVVDPQGKPMPFVGVQAVRAVAATRNPDQSVLASRVTDDRGEYRMFWVPPGEYVIRAFLGDGAPANPPAPPNTGQVARMVSTLFPDTTDITQATRVNVKSGEELRGIDIAVKLELVTLPPPQPKPASGFKVSGQVLDGLLPRVGTGTLMLGSERDPGPPRPVGTVIIGETSGVFEIASVPPGNYDLYVRIEDPRGSQGAGGAVQAWGRTTIEVRDQDVENVRMTIHPSVDVPGVVKVNGKVTPLAGDLRVGLSAIGTAGRIANYRGILSRAQTPDAQGKVSIPGAAEGNYDVFVQGGPDNLYIADVRQGDASILVSGIAVRDESPALFEVLLASDGGTVEGVVSNAEKKPAGNATVVLIPGDRQLLRLYRMATAGADGKYIFRGVRPGEYKVIAAPGLSPPGGITGAPSVSLNLAELSSAIELRGTSVTVKAATSATADVSVITD
jgi:hypothetical protein